MLPVTFSNIPSPTLGDRTVAMLGVENQKIYQRSCALAKSATTWGYQTVLSEQNKKDSGSMLKSG